MDSVSLRRFEPADIPWLVDRHQVLYRRDEGFDESFGPLVASVLEEFATGHDPARERGWIPQRDGTPLGSIFCTRLDGRTAKLRLFFLEPAERGRGVGKHMLGTCIAFARDAGYGRLKVWTYESHRAACALYAAQGFQLTGSKPARSFGVDLVEQSWQITL